MKNRAHKFQEQNNSKGSQMILMHVYIVGNSLLLFLNDSFGRLCYGNNCLLDDECSSFTFGKPLHGCRVERELFLREGT